jgi:hypothetical protein
MREAAVNLLRSRAGRFWFRLVLVVMVVHIAVNFVAISIIRARGGHSLDWVASDFGVRLYVFAVGFPVVLHTCLLAVGLGIAAAITRGQASSARRSRVDGDSM